MAILTKDDAQTLLKKVLSYSTADECEASLRGRTAGNIRYARNSVSTAGAQDSVSLAVESRFGKRSGVATCNEFDEATLRRCVQRAEEIAKLAPESPEYVPLLGPQTYLSPPSTATTLLTAATRAQAASESMAVCAAKNLSAAGFMDGGTRFVALRNSKGLEAYQQSTNTDFSVTVRTADGKGSGYAIADATDPAKLNAKLLTERAANKALSSVNSKAIEPGKYTVILEPAALMAGDDLSLLGGLMYGMGAREADEGRSFLSKKGGGNRKGEKLFDERVTIYSDPMNAEVPGNAFDDNGLPTRRQTWIEKGVVKDMFYSRFWAQKNNVPATAFPNGFVMTGGTQSTDELIKGTAKGILVTRLWYIREVDPQTLLYTGLTRDGTFYIENGKIKFPIKNLRFNESPIIMLNNIEAMGKPQRLAGCLVPPLKIRDFTFTSLSDAI
ncbi:TldD/PmbA family protein [Hymenobacter arizonensis]|uniref:Predicted Zn-dependent protease or its inactivated homolog n=1 Tax=Hymenobacter arizonensis TaxID=1227077 RepID=A0A1I5STH1_HYMAR|nr:TldD/PmbA family protein [Hymenobacter arizonensis]SFP74043.1 Predicted Zn-dependent protease or its inactivated homolog [Hymenobacter arizonensis]